MRVKMLRNIGRNLPDLVPDVDKADKATASALAQRALVDPTLAEGQTPDLDRKEAEFLKKYLLAEDAPEPMQAGGRAAPARHTAPGGEAAKVGGIAPPPTADRPPAHEAADQAHGGPPPAADHGTGKKGGK